MNQLLISVIHSIPDSEALIDTVLRHYPISDIRNCKLYKRGLNDTYLVETEQQRYILRVYRRGWRNKQEIDFELELLAFLHEQKQSVAYPIVRKNGVLTTEIAAPEGTRYVAVFSYGDVLPYCWFTEEWIDERLVMLKTLSENELKKILFLYIEKNVNSKISFSRTSKRKISRLYLFSCLVWKRVKARYNDGKNFKKGGIVPKITIEL
ncbi:phosphotransferase [Brasilonema sp. CT11]|nr:phosphotransferase [Brasilonema sp. CT11]